MDVVDLSKVKKAIAKLPVHVKRKFFSWAQAVELEGIRELRKIPGYHDEPLKGKLKGMRSIRLSGAYRAIYTEEKSGKVNVVIVEEVNKHEY